VESRDVAMTTTGLCRVALRPMTSLVTWLPANGDVGVAAAVTKVNKHVAELYAHTRSAHSGNSRSLWSPYVIGQTIIFLPCDFCLSFLFPRLISAAVDWMSTILPHMVWP